jgi:predicted short-subunit dehydrogenase-like oxidoreductase (DUF2520 family)
MRQLRISMVGTGNVSTVLGRLLLRTGHSIVSVSGRDKTRTEELAAEWGSESRFDFDVSDLEADFCILAVSDQAVRDSASWLRAGQTTTLHTAGSVHMEALKGSAVRYGVLYPLQSLNLNASMVPDIPFLVDGSTEETLHKVVAFARTLSEKVTRADDGQRADYHLAAVMSSNFINHLMASTEDYCRTRGLHLSNLQPLLLETLERAFRDSPSRVQTGPASRNDLDTIRRHLQRLEGMPELRDIYVSLSKAILKRHGHDADRI